MSLFAHNLCPGPGDSRSWQRLICIFHLFIRFPSSFLLSINRAFVFSVIVLMSSVCVLFGSPIPGPLRPIPGPNTAATVSPPLNSSRRNPLPRTSPPSNHHLAPHRTAPDLVLHSLAHATDHMARGCITRRINHLKLPLFVASLPTVFMGCYLHMCVYIRPHYTCDYILPTPLPGLTGMCLFVKA